MCDVCVEWGGKRWHRYGGGYYERTDKSARPKRTLRLHRAVWEHHNGPPPTGWHVHHRNEDKGDNRIENLDCMPNSTHVVGHNHFGTSGRRGWHKPEPFPVNCAACGVGMLRKVMRPEHVCRRCQQIRADLKREQWRACQHCGDAFKSRLGNFCSQRCVNLATSGATVRVLPEGRGRA